MTRWNPTQLQESVNSNFVTFNNSTTEAIAISNSSDFNFSGGLPFSMQGWVNFDSLANGDFLHVFSRNNGVTATKMPYALYFSRDATNGVLLNYRMYNTGLTQVFAISRKQLQNTFSKWNFFSFTFNGTINSSGCKFYVNAQLQTVSVDGAATLSTMDSSVVNNYIGYQLGFPSKGRLASIMVADKVLSQTEIEQSYNRGKYFNYASSSFVASILGWWDFSNNLLDSVGNHHGSASSTTYTPFVINKALVDVAGNDGTGTLNSSNKYLTITAAVIALKTALSSGNCRESILEIGEGDFATTPYTNFFDGLWVKGSKTPTVDNPANPTLLQNGTIIKGALFIPFSNIMVTELGVDSGSEYCAVNALPDGTDGLAIAGYYNGSSYTGYTSGAFIKNVVALCKSPTVLFHCFIIEHAFKPYFENVKSYYGYFGCVFKTDGGLGVNIEAYGNGESGLIIKSDSFNPNTRNVVVNGFKYRNINGSSPISGNIRLQAVANTIDNVLITSADLDSTSPLVNITGTVTNRSVTDLSGNTIV